MIVKYSDDFLKNKNNLKKYHYYYVMQGNENFKYRNIRLIKNTDKIQYIGDTHEYLNIPVNLKSKTIEINDFFIDDIGDGSNKSDKFDRDIRILENNIIVEPDNVRSYFYLANSYFDIGEYEKAIENYKIRIEKGGWFEEVSYSTYKIGICYLALKKYEKAVHKFMKAYQINPGRAESLYQIIRHYRIKKQYALSNLFFKQAITIPHPPKEALFINSDVYNYRLLYEFYIFYFYLNINDRCFYNEREIHDVFFKLLNHNCNVNNVINNYKFYSKQLDFKLSGEKIDIKRFDLTGVKETFNSSNISLLDYNDKLHFVIRYVNYYFNKNWDYVYRDKEATKNYLITYENDEELKDKSKDILIKEKKRILKNYDILEGLQDVRVLNVHNTIYYIGNVVFNYKDASGNCLRGSSIEYGTFNIHDNSIHGEIVNSPKKNMCEKNWALFSSANNKVFCIYKWHPLNIGLVKKNRLLIKLKTDTPTFFKHICGSTPGVLLNEHIIFICHLVCRGKPRHYYHIFVRLDAKKFTYVDHSYLFTFESQPVEYCCGMILKNNLLYITYSVRDNITKLLTIDPNDIEYTN